MNTQTDERVSHMIVGKFAMKISVSLKKSYVRRSCTYHARCLMCSSSEVVGCIISGQQRQKKRLQVSSRAEMIEHASHVYKHIIYEYLSAAYASALAGCCMSGSRSRSKIPAHEGRKECADDNWSCTIYTHGPGYTVIGERG